ncbi:uncharacterized protein LOC127797989 isoform X2 [Diospyros lotus]|uniref:uncharacterized protein LOC127797989 isoform X2 n=1 Tax=Diospyros lotus TaxID=55363 RepID=UPI00224D1869|nr:uncharacterized protein LOC127797989 isoform X2 [Diospyros lotus]
METAAGVPAARGVSLPSRKEWRAVSELSVRNAGSEDLERSKLGQSDERTIYEVQQGREPADVDFCSITIDGSSDNDILQQRLHNVAGQREELQQMEIDLRAQIIARSEILEVQKDFDAQIKEHKNANVKLQEQLHEMELAIRELERKMEEKDRELHTIKLDTEAAWAKEDLLRELSKELQTFRGERDNSEAERVQHLKQIHDLQEHIQEKDRQFLELQEQHRVAQETILYKDEQLREAQGWITRVQEMDALQSTTAHSLQAELRERTEQYNQLWIGCQRQFAEMERLHMHTIQQLQLELADARERSGTFSDEPRMSHTNSKDASQFGQNNGNQLDVNGSVTQSVTSGVLPNGNAENVSSFASSGSASSQVDHVHGVPIAPSSLLGMPAYLPSGQVPALHPLLMHQQTVPHSVPTVNQSPVGHFHSVPAISSLQHWQIQQAVSEGSQVSTHDLHPQSQTEPNLLRSDSSYDYEVSANGKAIHPDYLDDRTNKGTEHDNVIPTSAEEGQVDKSYLGASQPQQNLQHVSSQFRDLRLDPVPQNSEAMENTVTPLTSHGLDGEGFTTEQASSAASVPSSETPNSHANFSETTMNNTAGTVTSEAFLASGQKNTHTGGKTSEISLLDERSLLACIARTIPPGPGGRIRISSTLPNRLGKMLTPLHWHDYKRRYGKLDEFVAGHPELFLIEGDYIQLREGAQEIIAATAAVAKVAAAAKTASSPHSLLLPSVAVTPMAQPHRLRRAPSMELNGHESRPAQTSALTGVGNGTNSGMSGLESSVNKVSAYGRSGANFVGKQQGRTTGVASTFRR